MAPVHGKNTVVQSEQFWLDMAAKFRALQLECGDTPLRAERLRADGTLEVIPDVNGASVELCERLASEARERFKSR